METQVSQSVNICMKMLDLIEATLAPQERSVTLYHGTSLQRIKSILQSGLNPKITSTVWRTHPQQADVNMAAVFLSPSKAKAARYAIGPQKSFKPAILEIKLSSRKHLKHLQWDPLDREENTDVYDMSEGQYDEDIRDIEDDLKEILKRFAPSMVSRFRGLPSSLQEEIAENGIQILDGYDIHSLALNMLRQVSGDKFQQNKAEYMKAIQNRFPSGEYSPYLFITNSGTFRARPLTYQSVEQQRYGKHVPPAAIKAIWVRKDDFPKLSGETERFGIIDLPDEIVASAEEIRESLEYIYDKIQLRTQAFLDKFERRDYVLDDLKGMKNSLSSSDDHDDIVDEIDNLITAISAKSPDMKAIKELAAKIAEDAREAMDYLEPPDPWEKQEYDVTQWVRIPTTDTASIGTITA